MSVPLLMTKLFIPSPGKYLVGRSRLVEKLDRCLEPGCRLTLVSAPAGFGKTTLISAWIAASSASVPDRNAAWLSLDEGDNDPVTFWSYVIAALQSQQAGVGQQALDTLSVQGADVERQLASLINDLAQIQHPCVLVLDDYHLIRSPLIHRSLAFLLEHLPAHIHLVIASRTDPPLPLALLRGRGQLLEIRLNDLRFSDEDADRYLNAGAGLNLAVPSVQALNLKTEGWIAGLQMAALAMQDVARGETAFLPSPNNAQAADQNAAAGFVASFSGSNRFILDYLIEEVLNRQPEPIQQFLMRTSILDRLCGPLCDALLQDSGVELPGAQSALQHLESCNLFIVPLDQQRYWYRYHQLFADLLRKRLAQTSPDLVPELHRRAVQWYEQNVLIPSAIHHAFEMRDAHKAAALVAQVTEAMWGRGEHATLLAWMDALPDEEKRRYPHLLTFQVSILISAGKMKEAEACIPILEEYIAASLGAANPGETTGSQKSDPERVAMIGKIAELRTYIASFYGDRQAVFHHAQTALQHLDPEEYAGKRSGILLVLGNAYLSGGNLADAGEALVEAVAAAKKARKTHMALSGLANLAIVLQIQGQLSRGEQVCREGLQLLEQYGSDRSTMAVDILLALGAILCERGILVEAEPYIRRGLEVALEQQYIWQTAIGYQAKARLLLAQGSLADSETVAQAAVHWTESHPVPPYLSCPAAGLLSQILLRQGKTAQVEQYLRSQQVTGDGEIRFPRFSEYLALARSEWLRGGDASLEAAANLLDAVSRSAEACRQTGALVAALLLQSQLAQERGNATQALAFLGRALILAEPEGYVQIFVDAGEPAAELLREAEKQGIAPGYAARLLSAYPNMRQEAQAAPQPVMKTEAPNRVSPETIALVEPLSRREMETLQLMAEGYSNKEIAQKLFISLRTVKYYSTGIYNKLGVDSRMQAVNRARELGLL